MKALSLLVAILFLSALFPVTTATEEESRTYPNDWTHRPLVEHFGSLSAVYDMAYAAPAINQLVGDSENDTSNPYNIISFHQTNGGNGDDPFHTEDSKSRMRDHYGQNGVPNVQFDGNYRYVGGGGESNYQDYVEAIEDSGPREGEGNDEPFKIVDLDIYSEFSASDGIGQFEITVDIHYRGQTGGDGGIPTEPGDDDDEYLEGELYVFMVEDSVPAYSSYLDAIWNNRMVFREYAIDDEEFTLAEGGYATFSTVWELPTTQIDGDGVSGDIKIPINPGRMIPIAAVFDRDDTDSGNDQDTMGDDTYPTPRAIQSATPQSTAYDNSLEVSSVSSIQININYEDRVGIGVTFSDNIAISSAYVIYNFDDGELSFASMSLDNNNQNGNVFVDIEGELLSYRIVSFNQNQVFGASMVQSYLVQYMGYSFSSAPIITYLEAKKTETHTYKTYGDYGDVITYYKNGIKEYEGNPVTPVVHRAMAWVEVIDDINGTENKIYYIPEIDTYFYDKIELAEIGLGEGASLQYLQNSGYITKGDNNTTHPHPDQLTHYDITGSRVQPVDPSWIVATHNMCNSTEINFTVVNNGNFQDTVKVRISNLQDLEDAGFVLTLPALQYQIDSGSEQLIRVIVNSTGVVDTEKDYLLTLNVSTTLEGWDVSAENTAMMKFVECQGDKEEDRNETVDNDDSQKDKDNLTISDKDEPYEGDDAGECSDEADNDRNGLFDCDDEGCAGSPACKVTDSEDESSLPSVSMIPVLISIGLIARYRR